MKRWLSVLRLVAITALVGLPASYGSYCGDLWWYAYGYSRSTYSFAKYPQMMAYDRTDYVYSVAFNKAWYSRGLYSKSYGDYRSGSI